MVILLSTRRSKKQNALDSRKSKNCKLWWKQEVRKEWQQKQSWRSFALKIHWHVTKPKWKQRNVVVHLSPCWKNGRNKSRGTLPLSLKLRINPCWMQRLRGLPLRRLSVKRVPRRLQQKQHFGAIKHNVCFFI